MYSDAHFHFCEWQKAAKAASADAALPRGLYCACALAEEEAAACDELKSAFLASGADGGVFVSFGAHPQMPAVLARSGMSRDQAKKELSFLLNAIGSLAAASRIGAVGEAGFDFYTEEFAATATEQAALFDAQIEIALGASLPLVIHARKAQKEIFARARELKRLPAAVFHGYSGTAGEAASLLRRGVNAYFSFGKALLRGSRKAAESLAAIPRERLLLETDSPYMTLKGEAFTSPRDIENVAARAARILGISIEEIADIARRNFLAAYGNLELRA